MLQFNELGALRMQEHVRAVLDLLTGLEREQSVRPRFARLLQVRHARTPNAVFVSLGVLALRLAPGGATCTG